jgi:ATP-dependent RNA helicase HelY
VLASSHNYDADMPAGDFVRWARQVLDLLGQIKEAPAASATVRDAARKATTAINRGVLAYQGGL